MGLCKTTIEALKAIRKHASSERIVFVSGNFNIIHPGHLRLLRFAKECGDYLVVGVLDVNSEGAILPEGLRLEGIQSISWVDYGFILRDPPEAFIEALKPAFVVKGKEHEEKHNTESAAVEKVGGKLLFSSGDISFSSVDLMRKEWKELNLSTIKKPVDFPPRHGFTMGQLLETMDRMRNLRVCVIGDCIVDEYITCDPLGMSQEDPTIVVMPVVKEKFIGGAAIVAAHAKGLGAKKVDFFTITGRDDAANFSREELKRYKIEMHAYPDESRPTTLKQRYRADQKTLLRVSHLRHHAVSEDIRKKMSDDIRGILDGVDVVLFSDFNYGCLPQTLVDDIVGECVKRGILMAADSQSSSQMGDVSRFKGMTLLTPTEREARLSVRDFESGLVVLAEKVQKMSRTRNVIITLGVEGILIHAGSGDKAWFTDRLPALNTAPKDIAGAGDSLFVCAAMVLAAGANIWQSAYLGSLAAACQVGRIGNIPLRQEELRQEIER